MSKKKGQLPLVCFRIASRPSKVWFALLRTSRLSDLSGRLGFAINRQSFVCLGGSRDCVYLGTAVPGILFCPVINANGWRLGNATTPQGKSHDNCLQYSCTPHRQKVGVFEAVLAAYSIFGTHFLHLDFPNLNERHCLASFLYD